MYGFDTQDTAVEAACRLMDGGYNVVGVGTGPDENALSREDLARIYAIQVGLGITEVVELVELRQRFPAFNDNARAQEWGRTIAGRKPLPVVFWHSRAPSLALQTGPNRPE